MGARHRDARTPGGSADDDRELLAVEVTRLLELARRHLGLDVAFLGRFDDDRRTIQAAVAEDVTRAARLGGLSAPRSATYCELIAAGSLRAVTRDTRDDERLTALDVTEQLGIGSYVGVPLVVDGGVWGTVCAFGHEPAPHLPDDAAGALRFVADVIGERLSALAAGDDDRTIAAARIDELIGTGEPRMVGQQIVDLRTEEIVGVEALARFTDGDPDEMFALAALGRRSVELELAALTTAIGALDLLPPRVWLACNVSPGTATDPRFLGALDGIDARRLVVEVTETERLDDRDAVAAALSALRLRGTGIAMDDVGAAWSGLERALQLEPEILKLDRALITGVHQARNKQALVTAVQAFASEVGATLVAEGIEQRAEADTLRDLGVPLGQGWLFGHPRPLPLPDLVR